MAAIRSLSSGHLPQYPKSILKVNGNKGLGVQWVGKENEVPKKAQSHRGSSVEMCGTLLSLRGLSVQRKDSLVPGIKYCPEDGAL